ncbi:hypothetical protein ACWAUC_15165 [Bradyrhizobium guangdongense]
MHAIHLTIEVVLVLRLAVFGAIRRIRLFENPEVEVIALYRHLEDIVWIS